MTKELTESIKSEYWVKLETARAQEEMLGYHGDDCEDTERMVFFDDISFTLFSTDKEEEAVFQILLIYLLLLGIPIPKSRLNKNLLKRFSMFLKVIEILV